MFNSIYGKLTDKLHDSVFLLGENGIEWDIMLPALDIGFLPKTGENTRIFTWIYLREDQLRLYGFSSPERRDLFLELLKVEGIGPKAAIRILGNIGHEELKIALEYEDLPRLEAIPGLGKKTAQKMILTLKGKLISLEQSSQTPYKDLLEALTEMGYDKKVASQALLKAEKEMDLSHPENEKEQLLFKKAIVFLSGS